MLENGAEQLQNILLQAFATHDSAAPPISVGITLPAEESEQQNFRVAIRVADDQRERRVHAPVL
ncbi:MAG: hypothetical protein ABI837_12520 [Acidobacteriota bacterium]